MGDNQKTLVGNDHDPTAAGFERLEKMLQFFRTLAVLLSLIALVVPALVGYWIIGEDARALKRWESIQFESAVQRVPDRDVQHLKERINRLNSVLDESNKEMYELRSSMERLLGRLEEE